MGNICDICQSGRSHRSSTSQLVHVTSEREFREQLRLARDKLVLVDFYAEWCRPCAALAPRLEDLSNRHPSVVFLKVDVDELNELATHYGVASLPTCVLLKRGQIISTVEGSNFDKLKRLVNAHQ